MSVCLALFLAIFATVFWNYKQSRDSFSWALHSQEVLTNLSNLLSHFQDAETGQRGYLIMGQDHYLEPYHKAIALIQNDFQVMQQQTADNPYQQKKLTIIKLLMKEKLAELKHTIALRRSGGLEAALVVVKTDEGKNIMDKIRSVVAEIETEERRLIKERQAFARNTARITMVSQYAGITLILIVGGLVVVRMKRDIADREKAAEEIRTAHAEAESAN